MMEWLQEHQALVWSLGSFSVLSFFGTLVAIPVLVIRIPEDYFCHGKRRPSRWREHHPLIRLTVLVLKNLLGVLFILAGLAMLLLPGQGLLTLFIGLLFTNFPGKLELERRLVRRPRVHGSINWLRKRWGREPLCIPA